jgi:hypothetical protein
MTDADILIDSNTIGFSLPQPRDELTRRVLVFNISNFNVAIWTDDAIPIAAGGSALLDLSEGNIARLRNTTKFFMIEELPAKLN